MRSGLVLATVFFLASFCVFARSAEIITPVEFAGDDIVLEVTQECRATVVRYLKEMKYVHRETTRGTVGWEKERLTFPEAGRFLLKMDLSEAKQGVLYALVLVFRGLDLKYQVPCSVREGRLFYEEQ